MTLLSWPIALHFFRMNKRGKFAGLRAEAKGDFTTFDLIEKVGRRAMAWL